jgi:hypothetical protein
MTAMLTAPNVEKRPLFAAKDIAEFYQDKSPIIFPNEERKSLLKAHETNQLLFTEGDFRISDPDGARKQFLTT